MLMGPEGFAEGSMKAWVSLAVTLLFGCSSESINQAPASGGEAGASGAATGGEAGAGGFGASAGSGGSGGSAGSPSGGSDAGGTGGSVVTPACAATAAITKAALAKVTWTWQAYSDQKISTNQCISCAESPCDAVCQIMPNDIWWEDPWWFRAEATCTALTKVGTCGSESQCLISFKSVFTPRATLVPTATGWKITQLKGNSAGSIGYGVAPSACGSSWATPEPLWNSMKPGLVAAFEGAEFPCP